MLLPHHQDHLLNSGISQAVIDARGYHTVQDPADLAKLIPIDDAAPTAVPLPGVPLAGTAYGISPKKRAVPGIAIPLLDLAGNRWGWQYRPDNPIPDPPDLTKLGEDSEPKIRKYESPLRQRNHLDCPPGLAARLNDPATPLWFTEGIKKVDAGYTAGLAIAGLLGVDSWKTWTGLHDNGGNKITVPSTELEPVCHGRIVIICYDSDWSRKWQVRRAALALAEEIRKYGATVRFCVLPPATNGEKQGLDDFLVAVDGDAAVLDPLIRNELPGGAGKEYPHPGNPFPVAKELMDRDFTDPITDVPVLRRWREGWMAYGGGCWTEQSDEAVRGAVYSALEFATYREWNGTKKTWEVKEWNPAPTSVSACLDPLRSPVARLVDTTELGEWLPGYEQAWAARDMLALRNGMLHLGADRKLLPHTPALFTTVCVPFDYEPTATCPQWHAFLHSIWPDDPTPIALLQEMFGCVLVGRTDLQKIFGLIGASRGGKGTIAFILQSLIGHGVCAAPTSQMLAGTFGLETLIGKRLATISDLRNDRKDGQPIVERLLSISGEDALSVDRKNRRAWTGHLGVQFMILSNNPLDFPDLSGVIATRFEFLHFTRTFDPNPQLRRELSRELPGILNWSLDGNDRLTHHGRFTSTVDSGAMVAEMAAASSPVLEFLRDECLIGDDHTVEKQALYNRYKDIWCLNNGITRPLPSNRFGAAIKAVHPAIDLDGPRPWRPDGVRSPRSYAGITLRSDLDPFA